MEKQFMDPPVQPILEIKRTKECYCNICAKHTDNKQPVNKILLGCNNSSISAILCDDCLNQFSDKLWQYLEEKKKF